MTEFARPASDALDAKLDALRAELVRHAPVVVAFSGGADSAFLAAVAHATLGPQRARAVTAVSPSLAGAEEADCRALAAEWGLRWSTVATAEMERAAYRINDIDRCAHCKAELMVALAPVADADGATVAVGVNVDDLGDHRPGQRAAAKAGAVFPLVAAGFTKADVREASRRLGLRTWDKPAAACLASRVPYGTEVTVGILSRVERAEAFLHRLGFGEVRVRHYGDTARIEVPLGELEALVARRGEVVAGVRGAGYRYVTLDLEGFRSGNLNEGHVTSAAMKLSMMISYSGDFHADVKQIQALEQAGLDVVWIPEAYTFDAISQVGYLAAKTERIEIGTGIINVFSRTATAIAQTGAGCDFVSDGRFILGLGASGPQVIEGFHGVPYEKPMPRIREYIDVCRMTWRREPVVYDGQVVHIPLPAGEGTGLAKPLKLINHPRRADIPIFWASLMGKSVTNTARHADGWLPIFFDPEKFRDVWGAELDAGLADRDPALGPLQICAGGMAAIGEQLAGDGADRILDLARPNVALYVGGMGARDKNFYNTIATKYGYVAEAVEIQDLYLSGRKDEAAAAVPREMLANCNLVGPKGHVAERIAAFAEAGVSHLSVNPVGADPVATIETLREMIS